MVGLIGPYWEGILIVMGINAIAGLGFYLTFTTGQMSLCHGVFMGVGAYTSGLLSIHTSLPFPVVLLAGAVLAGCFGAVISYPTLHLKHFYLAITTYAFGQFMIILTILTKSLGGALGISGVPYKTTLYNVYLFLFFLIFCFEGLRGSYFLRTCKAIRKDELLVSVSGENVAKYRAKAFVLGAIICGIAGGFEIHYLSAVQPYFYGLFKSVDIFFYSIIGGAEIYVGPIFGAFVLTLLPEFLHALSEWRMVIYGTVLIVILVFRPQGLIDKATWTSIMNIQRRLASLKFGPGRGRTKKSL